MTMSRSDPQSNQQSLKITNSDMNFLVYIHLLPLFGILISVEGSACPLKMSGLRFGIEFSLMAYLNV